MKFEVKDLGYAYDALEPVIDEATMKFHHDKHHVAYCTNLNKALEGLDMDFCCVSDVLKNLDKIPAEKRDAVRNNGGGHYHHEMFWENMQPGGSKEPQGALAEQIKKVFGSFEEFKEKFNAAGAARFGSGWVWLVCDKGELKIVSTPNQDSPISCGQIPILGNDVWEHAYYLNYQNRRADYLKEWWKVVNWDVVGKRYDEARASECCCCGC